MKPAFHISLTATEIRLVAELAAIQSQIEWLMQLSLVDILGCKFATARKILGSTNMAPNSEIWIAAIREKTKPTDEKAQWAEWAFSEMAHIAKGRNDFLHTLFGFTDDQGANVWFQWAHIAKPRLEKRERIALRVKSAVRAPIEELEAVRNRAAYLSIAMAHIEALFDSGDGKSPWRRRLGGPLPPLKGETGPHKARERPPPPRSLLGK